MIYFIEKVTIAGKVSFSKNSRPWKLHLQWSNLSHGEKDILQRRISELKLWLIETVNKAI